MTGRGPKDVCAGTFAGLVGTVIGHPLDTIKVRLQTQYTGQYTGMVDCFIKITKTEGFLALYRGMTAPIVSLTILNSLSFGVYGQAKNLIKKVLSTENLSVPHYFLSGSLVGIACGFVSTPFEMVKVHLQLDNVRERKYKGSRHCAWHLLRNHGLKSLYYGFWVNMIREMVFCTIYFGLYENLKEFSRTLYVKRYQLPDDTRTPDLAILFCGGISGVCAWFGSFPLDVIKANVMSQSLPDPKNKYVNARHAIQQRWKVKGIKVFYSGVGPSLIRAFFVSGTRFSAYEFAIRALTSLETKYNFTL